VSSRIDASVRDVIVRQLGAALAEAWRAEHHRHDEAVRDHQLQIQEEDRTSEGATAGASTLTVAV
jgi:hypothetical protein